MDPLISTMYAAVADERQWPVLLSELDAAFGGVASWLLVFKERTILGAWATGDLREVASVAMAACHAEDDWENSPSLGYCLEHPTQAFVDFADYFPAVIMAQDPVLDMMEQSGLGHITGAVSHVPGGLAVLNLCRPSATPFADADMQRLDALHPHWAQALELAILLGATRAQEVSDTLQALTQPAAVLSHHGAMMACNAGFEQHLSDWATLTGGQHLQPHDPACAEQFAQQLAWPDDVAPAPISATGQSGQPLYLHLLHLQGAASDCFLGGQRLLTVQVDAPDAPHAASAGELQRRWGLSASEAQLACLLASGNNLRQAGAALAISYASARTYLDRIYAKTDVNRQVDLVRLVLRMRVIA